MVELVDTQRSERCTRKSVEVQVLFRPPNTIGKDLKAGDATGIEAGSSIKSTDFNA